MSTSSLIRPSYTMRATIFERVFRPEKLPKMEYFPTKRIISLPSRTCKFSSRICKLYYCPYCLLLPHNLYFGAKHIPLLSYRLFHFHCSIAALWLRRDKHNNIIYGQALKYNYLSSWKELGVTQREILPQSQINFSF